jgi:CBS domain-containing protein
MKVSVSTLLQAKEQKVLGIDTGATVFEAVKMMTEYHVGALLVLNKKGGLSGIISERDCFTKVVLKEKSPRKMLVKDIMTKRPKIVTVSPDRTIEDCMETMAERHIRHLPVLRGETVLGVVSMRDVVRFLVSEQDLMIKNLEKYIEGSL